MHARMCVCVSPPQLDGRDIVGLESLDGLDHEGVPPHLHVVHADGRWDVESVDEQVEELRGLAERAVRDEECADKRRV